MSKLDPNGLCDSVTSSKFWMFVHDGIAHPLLVLTLYSRWAIRFHDWSSFKAWPNEPGTTRGERKADS